MRSLHLVLILFVAVAIGGMVTAQETPEARFTRLAAALEKGAFQEAIDGFEALADSGFEHPDASYDRAIAYVERARSPQAEPGDLGRAAAALVETLELRPSDREARAALETVRDEIAQRRIRAGGEPAVVSPSLGRAVVGLLDEAVWTTGAVLGSLLLSIGLAIRWAFARSTVRLGGGITASVGALLFATMGPLTAAAAHYRTTSQLAVVVASEARLLSEDGVPIEHRGGPDAHVAVPEGASVHIVERRGRLARIDWGTTRAWVNASQLRAVAIR